MSEADIKRLIVKSMHEHGGYGRRLEDQYAVGIFDLLLIPKALPVFMAEVKMITGKTFGPTPRQYVELSRIVDLESPHAIPLMIGHFDGTFYFHPPALIIRPADCFSVTTGKKVPFYEQLVMYYHSTRK